MSSIALSLRRWRQVFNPDPRFPERAAPVSRNRLSDHPSPANVRTSADYVRSLLATDAK